MGPLADMGRSLELVCSGGRLLRVDRANGPSDARAFARARYTLRAGRIIHDSMVPGRRP